MHYEQLGARLDARDRTEAVEQLVSPKSRRIRPEQESAAGLRRRVVGTELELTVVQRRAEELEKRTWFLEAELGRCEGELGVARMELKQSQEEAAEQSRRTRTAVDEAARVQKELDETSEELYAALETYGEVREGFAATRHRLEAELEHARVKLVSMESGGVAPASELAEIKADRAMAEMRVEQLSSEIEASRRVFERLNEKCHVLETERDQAQAELGALKAESSSLHEIITAKPNQSSSFAVDLEELQSLGPASWVEQQLSPVHSSGQPAGSPVQQGGLCAMLDEYSAKVEEQHEVQTKLAAVLAMAVDEEDEEGEDPDSPTSRSEQQELVTRLESQTEQLAQGVAQIYARARQCAAEHEERSSRSEDREEAAVQLVRVKAAFEAAWEQLSKRNNELVAQLKGMERLLESSQDELKRTQRQRHDAQKQGAKLRTALEDIRLVEALKHGGWVLKYHQGGGTPQNRWLQLSPDETEVRWSEKPQSSKFSSLLVAEVTDMSVGWDCSPVFSKCSPEDLRDEQPWRCATIMARKRTFDCSFKTEEDVVTWCRGLMSLVCTKQADSGETAPSTEWWRTKVASIKESAQASEQASMTCASVVAAPGPSFALGKFVRFNDVDGDQLEYRLTDGRLTMLRNGRLLLDAVEWLAWNPATRMLQDPTMKAAPLPEQVDATHIEALAAMASSPTCEWRSSEHFGGPDDDWHGDEHSGSISGSPM